MKETLKLVVVIVVALVASVILCGCILGAYAYCVNRVVENSPIKTSVVTKKSHEFRGTTITIPTGSGGGPVIGQTLGKIQTKISLKNGDYVISDADTINIGDTITYKAFMIMDVKKNNNNPSQDKN